jgi:hypothetical protein
VIEVSLVCLVSGCALHAAWHSTTELQEEVADVCNVLLCMKRMRVKVISLHDEPL